MVSPSLGPAPVPGAIPVLPTDSLQIAYRTVQSAATAVAFNIRYMDPNGQFQTYKTPAFSASTTTWALTVGMSLRQLGFAGWITNIAIAAGIASNTAVPGGLYFEFSFGTSNATADSYAIITKNTQAAVNFVWKAGDKNESPFFHPDTPGKLYSFQGTVTNGAGGAGTQGLTVTPATGGRFQVVAARMINGDGSARLAHIYTDDTTNVIADYWFNNLNPAGIANVPSTAAGTAAGSLLNDYAPLYVAGSSRFVMDIAAVAASEDSTYALTLLVWGAAPTFTLAGASTPTLTTNTSRFEAG